LRESASDLVDKVAPKPTPEEYVVGLKKALETMNQFGITGLMEASASESHLNTYAEAEKRGILSARVTICMYADPEGTTQQVMQQIQKFKQWREKYQGKNYRATAIKIFADGVVEANTAAMIQPYLDNGKTGILNWDPEKLNAFVTALDREKFQVHVHAIGDRGVQEALDAFEYMEKQNGIRDARPIIAHIEVFDPHDISRFAALHVIPCFQPLWSYADTYIKDLTAPKLGPERMRWIYPQHSVLITGANLAFGSDWSVSSVNPLDGIKVAVTRQDPEQYNPAEVFLPEERIDLPSALAAYTIGSAYATFREKDTGSIEVGKNADIIVLSDNLFEVPPERINKAKVMLTLLEGKTIYRDSALQ